MTNLGMAVYLMATHASMQLERLQQGLAKAAPVSENGQEQRIEVTVEGELDLRGTLGISKDVPVGFESVHLHFDVAASKATPEQLRGLQEKTEQYCVVMQTLMRPPRLQTEWVRHN